MSMDLFIWKSPITDDPDVAAKLVNRYYDDEDESVFAPSPDIGAYAQELRGIYSDDPTDMDDSPWSSLPFEESDRLLALNIRWSADNKVLDDIVELARKHDLVIYDPQGPAVYLPTDEEDNEPPPPLRIADHAKIWAMFLGFLGITIAAWWIPWGWVRWPVMFVGGFLTISAGIVVYATAFMPDEEKG